MGVIYQHNFDTDPVGALPANWSNISGSWAVGTADATSGNSLTSNGSDGNAAILSVAAPADQAIQFTQVSRSVSEIAPILRDDGTGNNHYLIGWSLGGSIYLYKWVGGSGMQINANIGTCPNFPANTPINVKAEAAGTTIRIKFWAYNTAEPATWNGSTTDSTFSTGGSVGVRVGSTAGQTTGIDNVYVGDAGTSFGAITITPTASNWSDNGYDLSTENYIQTSEFARLTIATDATSMAVTVYTDIYGYNPPNATVGVRINGAAGSFYTCPAAGVNTFTVTLPGTLGTTVEIINGSQNKGGSDTWQGTYVTSLSFSGGTAVTVVPPAAEPDKLVVYGDSIVGAGPLGATPFVAWSQQLRSSYGHVHLEAYGGRRLFDDCPNQSGATALANRLAGYSPAKLLCTIGVNDHNTAPWGVAAFATAYGQLLDAFHAAAASTPVILVSPLLTSSSEAANSQGDTLPVYRSAIAALATGRPWLTVYDGSTVLTTADLSADGVHPSAAGQVKLGKFILGVVASAANVVLASASSVAGTLSWPPVVGATGYTILKNGAAASTNQSGNSYAFTGAAAGDVFTVAALNGSATSPAANYAVTGGAAATLLGGLGGRGVFGF